jgi:hypothetical protein
MSHPNDRGLDWRVIMDHSPRGEAWSRYLEVFETDEQGKFARVLGSVYAEAHETNEEAIRACWEQLKDPVGPAWCADRDEYGEMIEAVKWLADALGINLETPNPPQA